MNIYIGGRNLREPTPDYDSSSPPPGHANRQGRRNSDVGVPSEKQVGSSCKKRLLNRDLDRKYSQRYPLKFYLRNQNFDVQIFNVQIFE